MNKYIHAWGVRDIKMQCEFLIAVDGYQQLMQTTRNSIEAKPLKEEWDVKSVA